MVSGTASGTVSTVSGSVGFWTAVVSLGDSSSRDDYGLSA